MDMTGISGDHWHCNRCNVSVSNIVRHEDEIHKKHIPQFTNIHGMYTMTMCGLWRANVDMIDELTDIKDIHTGCVKKVMEKLSK